MTFITYIMTVDTSCFAFFFLMAQLALHFHIFLEIFQGRFADQTFFFHFNHHYPVSRDPFFILTRLYQNSSSASIRIIPFFSLLRCRSGRYTVYLLLILHKFLKLINGLRYRYILHPFRRRIYRQNTGDQDQAKDHRHRYQRETPCSAEMGNNNFFIYKVVEQ